MSRSGKRGFTLVELLIVVGIIAILISLLLPALSGVRAQSYSLKCSSNLRSIGQGMAIYLADNLQTFPASNYYSGLKIASDGTQSPSDPTAGYVHWSSFLYGDKDQASNPDIYKSTFGWELFQCPSLDKGGLPPANTYAGNNDGLANEAGPGVLDQQAPRLAYTVNEALCPRGIFQKGFRGANRPYRYVRASQVKSSATVILATELSPVQSVVQTASLLDGSTQVSGSRRPVHGFLSVTATPDSIYQTAIPFGNQKGLYKAGVGNLSKDPELQNGFGETLINAVGRNHGSKSTDGTGYDTRKSNFLYVDGHVEGKQVRDTLKNFEWGDEFYSLNPGYDVAQ